MVGFLSVNRDPDFDIWWISVYNADMERMAAFNHRLGKENLLEMIDHLRRLLNLDELTLVRGD